MEESGPSIFFPIRSYFTPTVLFVLLNLVIGTIALTSKNIRRHRHGEKHHPDDQHQISRSSSTVLERVHSIGLFRFRSAEIPVETLPIPPESDNQVHDFRRIQSESDSHPKEAEVAVKKAEVAVEKAGRMNKSVSARSARTNYEDWEIVRRPVTSRGGPRTVVVDEEVDARADDFINRFRQQLKLQRLDSILRYKEMLNHGK